jgi:hypothetical protein
MMNPETRNTILQMKFSDDEADQEEYSFLYEQLCETAESVVRLLLYWDSRAVHGEEFQSLYNQFKLQYAQYLFEPGRLSLELAYIGHLSPERWWMAQRRCVLSRVGRIMCTWPASSTNIERLMKVNALVHCTERASLMLTNADRLVRGYVAMMHERESPSWTREEYVKWFADMEHLDDVEEEACDHWAEQLAACEQAVKSGLQQANATGSFAVVELKLPSPEDEDNEPHEPEMEEQVNDEPAPADRLVEEWTPALRRSARSQALSSKFRAVVAHLKKAMEP